MDSLKVYVKLFEHFVSSSLEYSNFSLKLSSQKSFNENENFKGSVCELKLQNFGFIFSPLYRFDEYKVLIIHIVPWQLYYSLGSTESCTNTSTHFETKTTQF